jgi:isopentenyldiphosphate isomerase
MATSSLNDRMFTHRHWHSLPRNPTPTMIPTASPDEPLYCYGVLIEPKMGNRSFRRTTILGAFSIVAIIYAFSAHSLRRGENNEIRVYQFKGREPSHMDPVNMEMEWKKSNKLVSIDDAHKQGLAHRGNWIYVVDSLHRIFVLKRGPQLVTCPNAWSLVGEHTFGDETTLETTQRGIREELGDNVLQLATFMRQLGPHPLYYFRAYGPSNMNRVDRQLTSNWWVQLSVPGESVPLKLDDEVADHKWVTIREVDEWLVEDWKRLEEGLELKRLCHITILQLMQSTLEELKKGLEKQTLPG